MFCQPLGSSDKSYTCFVSVGDDDIGPTGITSEDEYKAMCLKGEYHSPSMDGFVF